MGTSIRVEREDAVCILTLDRPEKFNAFAGSMAHDLRAALEQAGSDASVRAVLIKGTGRGFCAGQDLNDIVPGQDLGRLLEDRFNPLIRTIRSLPKPVVCAVQGIAAGAGASLAFACDIVLAAQSARFLQAFIRIGLIPDAGGTWLLQHLAGDARARGMAMLGEPISAAQAEAWGLIWRVVPDEALAHEAMSLAHQLAALPTHAIALIKRAFDSAAVQSLDKQLDTERDLQRDAGFTPDFQEGVRAFIEKRPAVFTGKTTR